ncbi:MAG: hypothetical protein SGJ09_01160 [Phycisphaerae bacterium]|nr:hypothetical protein [Phycisphaerae bacterium]
MHAPDDTGVEREIASFAAGDVPDLRHPVARGALARLRSTAATQRFGWPRAYNAVTIAVIVVVCASGPALVFAWMRWFRLPPIWLFFTLIPALGATIFCLVALSSVMAGRALGAGVHLIATALLRMGRCASCGYPLDAIPADVDGILRCPECGAGWRGDRVGREAVPGVKPSLASFARSSIVLSAMCRTRQRDDRGRPFQAIAMTQLGADSTQRAKRRVTLGAWKWIVAMVLTILACVALCVIALLFIKTMAAVLPIFGLVVIGVLTLIAINARSERITRERQLRSRMCLACEQRLRSEGNMLVCTRCEGAWTRPLGRAATAAIPQPRQR